ncbi:MAG: hypothetical protein FWD16_05155 [Clostridia bacterium]|nr:hypothetical protein [Clostridia bacterium]
MVKKHFNQTTILLASILALQTILLALIPASAALYGDVNGDGMVNVDDILAVRDAIFGVTPEPEPTPYVHVLVNPGRQDLLRLEMVETEELLRPSDDGETNISNEFYVLAYKDCFYSTVYIENALYLQVYKANQYHTIDKILGIDDYRRLYMFNDGRILLHQTELASQITYMI